ncbi:uncharacterized protein LTR77_010875 [Saxophila tyrrhenica]|uniref:Major facilitator superfamily (MFS) profile domain-containing protein n=1 Tax=Saxophila tyrrhenica TaxID=1690608 RepID=A0AAV9NUD3_9PEZI|nr:hypothetical protein LTR77_010875 [Saxophila tyrrhenica]
MADLPTEKVADTTVQPDSSSDEEDKLREVLKTEVLRDENDPDNGKTPEERAAIDKTLMRKVDRWLIPWMCLLYLLSFLDRTNIGNARVAGIEDDLGMEGHDYNNTLTIFFISYALAEPMTNVLLKRMTPRVFFTSIIVAWGVVMTLMGLVTSYGGLLAARFALGLAEAGLYPGWYIAR